MTPHIHRASLLWARAHGLYGVTPWAIKRGSRLGRKARKRFRPRKLQLRLARPVNRRVQWINQHSPTHWQQWRWSVLDNRKRAIALRRANVKGN